MSKNFVDNDNMTALMTAVGNKLSEKSKIFYGSETDWNNLTVAQKKEYDYWASPEDDGYTTSRVITKLWENPDPTVTFAAQNITLASDNYDFLLILFMFSTTNGNTISEIIKKGSNGFIARPRITQSETYTVVHQRSVTYVDDTTYSFGVCSMQNSNAARTTSNSYIIPYMIFGINMSVTPTSSEIDYSTDEQMIGHWIDGKPLYQKTVSLGNLPNATSKNVAHGISNLDLVIDLKGIARNSNGQHIPLNFVATDNVANGCNLRVMGNNINVNSGIDRSGFTGYCTIQYTKTTD